MRAMGLTPSEIDARKLMDVYEKAHPKGRGHKSAA